MLFSRTRDIIGILGLVVIALLGIFAFKFIDFGGLDGLRSNFVSDWRDLSTSLKIVKENTRDLFLSPRKRSYGGSLIAQENLKQLLPIPFGQFSEADWGNFWDLIYGLHERDDYGANYTPKRKRQLSIGEIEEILIKDYPHICGRFNAQFWEEFWKLVFAKR